MHILFTRNGDLWNLKPRCEDKFNSIKMKLIPYLLGTALTLLPSTAHGDDYQIVSYKANKEQACLELRIKTEIDGAKKEELVTLCDGTNGDRDDKIDDVIFAESSIDNVEDSGSCIGVNYQQLRDDLVDCYVNTFLDAIENNPEKVIRFDTKKKQIYLETEEKMYLLYADKENKTHRFCVVGNGFSISIKQDPFTDKFVDDLYQQALEIKNN